MGKGQDLLNAARAGDKWTVEKIIGILTKRSGPFTNFSLRKCGLNVQDDTGYTPLHHACLNGHTEVVRLLLSAGASPSVVDKTGASPLHLAAWKGDSAIVAMLLAQNPPVNIDLVTANQETPLIMAAQYGSVNVVAQLVDRGADVTLRNVKDESALDLAAQYGRLPTVKHLLATHPTLVHQYKYPNWRVHKFSSTPLHRAAKNGHVEVVQLLLAAGIDPNIRTNSGTPLHEAACFGKASVVRILLEAGADLNEVDGKNKTVEELLADYSEEATRRVRRAIREFKNSSRYNYDNEEEPRPLSIQECSPTSYPHLSVAKAPETQKNYNLNHSLLTPSSSFVTKNSPQSFVKKLASKCLGLKAKFNSAPNISNQGLESNVDGKLKHSDIKHSVNALHIGNSKFFKILSKKEESGDIPCNDEFDTISLDRLGTLNRDSTVNRSNRSCPGFKTSLPNISENNELSDESVAESSLNKGSDCDGKNKIKTTSAAFNYDTKHTIFEPRKSDNRISITSDVSVESTNLVNECYESYEFTSVNFPILKPTVNNVAAFSPKPSPRSNFASASNSENTIYENLLPEKNNFIRPTPAARTYIPTKVVVKEEEKKVLYENILIQPEVIAPEPPKRSFTINTESNNSSPCRSRSSTMSSDSMIDESNLEDILLSEKSRSFRHGQKLLRRKESSKSSIHRTQSNASEFSDTTEVSAIENVDCSADIDEKPMYASMVGTLPNKKSNKVKKKVLFRHKTFTNIEHDRNSMKNFPKRNDSFLKDTLANYHIRGTGHCIYKAPTVKEFIYIFNRDTLYRDVEPFTKVPYDKRDSYFETAICFCRPRPNKHHTSAEDLLDIQGKEVEESASIDIDALVNKIELVSSSFRCFCDSGACSLHASRREFSTELVVKFSAIKKSISTPNITLEVSPSSTEQKRGLLKNKSVPANLEEPYAVVNIDEVVKRNEANGSSVAKVSNLDSLTCYVSMSPHSSLTSTGRPYSIKDISEVISLGSNSTTTGANTSCAYDTSLLHKSNSEHSGHWSLQSCNSNNTMVSDVSFKTCLEESSDESDETIHSDDESSDAETIKSDVSTTKRPWIHSSSFRFNNREIEDTSIIEEDSLGSAKFESSSSKFESGISVGSVSSSSDCGGDSGVPGEGYSVSLGASLERGGGMVGRVRSGSGRRRWDEAEGASEGDALSVSSAASSCAPLHMTHHHEYSKVSPTPPKKPPRRNLSVSPTHVNSPSSGYSYELRTHARSQDDLDEIQDAKHYLKHGRSVDQYVDSKLSYSEYEENHNSPRVPVPNPRPSLKNRTQPVAITAMYENVVIKEQNPRRKLRRNTFGPQHENFESRMADKRVRKYSNQERSSMESLLDDQSMNSPSECERYSSGSRVDIPLSPTHYEQPPTPDHPPPSAKQAENSIHERIRPLSQLIMEVVEEIRIRKKSQGDVVNS